MTDVHLRAPLSRLSPALPALQALAVAALAGLPAVGAQAMPADKVYALVAPSVWVVLATNEAGNPTSLGSAVVVAPETVITNCHVLKDASGIRVRREQQNFRATLQYPDVARDLCQLRVPGLPAPAVRIAPLSGVAVGQKAYAIGDPRGLEATLSDGLVSSLRRDAQGHVQYIQTSAPLSPGSSGGGLFDEDGGLIGITSSGISTGVAQNLNFARPAEYIAQVPERGRANLVAYRAKTQPADVVGSDPALLVRATAVASVAAAEGAGPAAAPVQAPAVAAAPARAVPVAIAAPAAPAAPAPAPAALPAPAPVPAAMPAPPPAPVAVAPAGPADVARVVVPVTVAAAPAPAPVFVPPAAAPVVRVTLDSPDAEPGSLASFAGRTPDMQAAYEEFLGKRLPRAFAVSNDGHFAIAYGVREGGRSDYSADVPSRAVEYCQRGGGEGCTLFAVDGKVVYESR